MLSPSSSLGGARPKTTVIDGSGQLWIAKFPSRHDRWNNAIVEAAYLRLASEFGIRTPEARILRIGARPVDDARELYKRAIFNALTSNEDDHPRNHAVIWDGDGWRLSPAYDLTPSSNRS